MDADGADREIMGGFFKGLKVIEAFDGQQDALTIADVSRLTGLDRATARRCLLTLERKGYAELDGKRFRLTARILRLGYSYLASTPLPRLVQPYLDRLSDQIQESSSVSVLDGTEIVYVARAAQRRVLSIGLNVGSRLPAYCASMGRVLLAALPEAEARRILHASERRKLTARTLTDIEDLMAELARIRAAGYCIVDEELEIGLRSIAIPLHNMRGETVAAMNIGVQSARAPRERLEGECLGALKQTQGQVAAVLR